MVRNYVRKTNHNTYDIKTIISALKTLKKTKKSITQVAKDYNMKMSALSYHWRRHNKENIDIEENVMKKRYTLRVFSNAQEEELLSYVIMCAEVHLTVAARWIRQLAYELAVERKIVLPPNWEKHKIAGKDWFLNFKDRHAKALVQLIPDTLILEQIMGTHRNKGLFFKKNYNRVLAKYKFQPKDVYVLEQCKLHEPGASMLAETKRDDKSSKKQDAPKSSPSKGKSLVTFVGTVSAIGQSIPPFYIFSYTRYQKHQLLQDAPQGSKAKSHPSGIMTKKIFLDYLRHFVEFVKSNDDTPVLLLIDDNRYHISLANLKYAKQHGIVILTFPRSTTNKVQLLEQCMCPPTETGIADVTMNGESEIDAQMPSVSKCDLV
ncbi:uncharacterized protein LOC131666459 [Phymastichus coffea]|uniref:uncharacterized protein LOC131666459 n=1 Tax=Phymastichus coffea TaxID=108790 RepID=UPI00273AF701|nr:uncharacterized protein LOC131666459 [Phymastichus coffea]